MLCQGTKAGLRWDDERGGVAFEDRALTSGFSVVATLTGEQARLELEPFRVQEAPPGPGARRVHQVSTVVVVPVGSWSLVAGRAPSSDARTYSAAPRLDGAVLVRVDVVSR